MHQPPPANKPDNMLDVCFDIMLCAHCHALGYHRIAFMSTRVVIGVSVEKAQV